jgi:hypothetical protein
MKDMIGLLVHFDLAGRSPVGQDDQSLSLTICAALRHHLGHLAVGHVGDDSGDAVSG